MEGAATCSPPQAREAAPRRQLGRDAAPLVALLLLAAGTRLWVIANTEVAARDSIGFIRYAWQLERLPLAKVLRDSPQHPGYPVLMLAVSQPVRYLSGGTDARSMQLSAQLTSALAGILLVIPMFYLGRELFSRDVGFWSAALFQCLPVSGQILSDGLSEATFLLFSTAALLAAVRGVKTLSPACFALCGLFVGLSYLTRPEGLLMLPAVAAVLLGWQFVRPRTRPWSRTFACAATVATAAVLVSAPYVGVIGRLTNKPTPLQILNTSEPHAFEVGPLQTGTPQTPWAARATATGQPPFAVLLADYLTERGDLRLGLWVVARMTAKGFFYVGWVFAVLGLWWFRDRLREAPGACVPLVLCLLHALVVWRLAVVVGYVSERHVLVLVLCLVYWAAADVIGFGQIVVAFWRRQGVPPLRQQTRASWAAVALLLALATPALAATLQPLHPSRAGHRAAGLWLARHARPGDVIYDPASWAHFYAGWLFREDEPVRTPYTRYVVYEPRHQHDRLPLYAAIPELTRGAEVVYHWPEDVPAEEARVQVKAVRVP